MSDRGESEVPWKLLVRDGLILVASLWVWRLATGGAAQAGGLFFKTSSVASGILLGLVWGYAAHEWGHLAGARLGRAMIHLRTEFLSVQLFRFHTQENDRSSFLWMAWGGLVVLWIQAAAFAALLPLDTVGGLAAVIFALAGALLTTVVEGPIAWRVLRGGALPRC